MSDKLINCERCGAAVELDESDIIFADSIGRDAFGPDIGWLCSECGLAEAMAFEDDDDGPPNN